MAENTPTRIRGCTAYRMALELSTLNRRLAEERLEEREREDIEERIREIEEALGL